MNTPDYLTRFYQEGDHPFVSLNDLPLDEANTVKKNIAPKTISAFFTLKMIISFIEKKLRNGSMMD